MLKTVIAAGLLCLSLASAGVAADWSIVEANLSGPPFSMAFAAPEEADGARSVTGATPSNMQMVQLTGPAGSPEKAKVMVDLRPENMAVSVDLMKRVTEWVAPTVSGNEAHQFVDRAITETPPGGKTEKVLGGCKATLDRKSDVMAILTLCH